MASPLNPDITPAETSEEQNFVCNFPQYLPDDVLLEIFSRLSTTDLLSVQKTCVNFKRIGDQRILWRNVHLEQFDDNNIDEYTKAIQKKSSFVIKLKCVGVTVKLMKNVVSLCHNVTHLTLVSPDSYCFYLLTNVGQSCPKIQHLEVDFRGGTILESDNLVEMSGYWIKSYILAGITVFKNLESLCLRDVPTLEQEPLGYFVSELERLQTIELHVSHVSMMMIKDLDKKPPTQLKIFSITTSEEEVGMIKRELTERSRLTESLEFGCTNNHQ